MSRILCVAPGPTHSTFDVWNGLVGGLRGAGHTVGVLALHGHLEHAGQCLRLQWENREGGPPPGEIAVNEIIYHASEPVVTRALLHRMDAVLFVATGFVHDAIYGMLRQARVTTSVLLTESPYEDARQAPFARLVDVCWTNERASVPFLRERNPHTFYLPHAYDPAVHRPSDPDPTLPQHDVVFVGTLWQERVELFSAVDWSGIDIGIYGTAEVLQDPRNAPYARRLEPYLHEGYVSNAATAALYRNARIGLNPHRTSTALGFDAPRIVGAESLNPRCYEQAATGGALLLTDPRAEAFEVFGEAIPTFEGPDQLAEQVRYFLAHETERADRVRALREAVAPHTFAARAAQITADLAAANTAKGA